MKLEVDNDFFLFYLLYTYISQIEKEKKTRILIATNFLNEQHCSVVQNMFLVTFFRMFSFSVYKNNGTAKAEFSAAFLVCHSSSFCSFFFCHVYPARKNRLISRYFIFHWIPILFFYLTVLSLCSYCRNKLFKNVINKLFFPSIYG